MPPAASTPKASRPRIAVINHAQQVSGIRIIDIPLARMSRVVVMKFSAPISEAAQKRAMLVIQRSAPSPSPGPELGTALSGA